MPKSNAKYPFQYKVPEKTGELGARLFGEKRVHVGFIIQLDESGQIIKKVSEEKIQIFCNWMKSFILFFFWTYLIMVHIFALSGGILRVTN